MGDLAFSFDSNKGYSDIQVAGGDFLLCDTDTIESTVPLSGYDVAWTDITLSGAGAGYDGLYTFKGGFIDNGTTARPIYSSFSTQTEIAWASELNKWRIYSYATGEYWLNPATTLEPPKAGWGIGQFLGSTAPSLSYVTPVLSIDELSKRVSSLEAAIGLSLFTDRRATNQEIVEFQVGLIDRQMRRGYWGNTYRDFVQGSGVWLLERSKKQETTRSRAEVYCKSALQWLLNDGIAAEVRVSAQFTGSSALSIGIAVVKPTGEELNYKYQYVWE